MLDVSGAGSREAARRGHAKPVVASLVVLGLTFGVWSCESFSASTPGGDGVDGGNLPDATSPTADAATEAANPCAFAVAGTYHVFVTSKTVFGTFAAAGLDGGADGGNVREAILAKADELCVAAGRKVNACSQWKALLWVTGTPPNDRLVTVAGGFHRVGGAEELVFVDRNAVLGNPMVAILRDETGSPLADGQRVWTGGSTVVPEPRCGEWQSAGPGTVGDPRATDAKWMSAGVAACSDVSHHLYCFEQPPN